ncbi:hypothetical protein [Aestuariivirga sp.]|uniref:hypothetical protein n=1 Tax=Aestuariivirga sp. TaxID=2650926 RepID=UPI0035942465
MMFSWLLSPLGRWLSLAGTFVATLTVVWLKGRAAGKAAWEEKRHAAREKAMKQSKEIRHDVQTDSDAALDCRLDRWMRD